MVRAEEVGRNAMTLHNLRRTFGRHLLRKGRALNAAWLLVSGVQYLPEFLRLVGSTGCTCKAGLRLALTTDMLAAGGEAVKEERRSRSVLDSAAEGAG